MVGAWVWGTLINRYRSRATAGAGAASGAGPLTLRAVRVFACVRACESWWRGGDRQGQGAGNSKGRRGRCPPGRGSRVSLLVLRDLVATTWSVRRAGSGKPGGLPTAWGREGEGSGWSEYSHNCTLRGVGGGIDRREVWGFPGVHPHFHTRNGRP